MRDSIEVMTVALRVLFAVSHKREADPTDVEALEEYAGPKPRGMDVDEFACSTVQDVLKKRANRPHMASGVPKT